MGWCCYRPIERFLERCKQRSMYWSIINMRWGQGCLSTLQEDMQFRDFPLPGLLFTTQQVTEGITIFL